MTGVDPCLPGTVGTVGTVGTAGTAGTAGKKGGPEKGSPGQMLFIKREFITHLNFTPTD